MTTYRELLRQAAFENDGYVTAAIAREFGVPAVELRKLAGRGAVEKRERGVYRDPYYPAVDNFDYIREIILTLGDGAYVHGETVLDIVGIGQLNPKNVYIASSKRHRRQVPNFWKIKTAPPGEQVKKYSGIPAQSVAGALEEVCSKVMPERWKAMVDDALEEGFILHEQYARLKGLV